MSVLRRSAGRAAFRFEAVRLPRASEEAARRIALAVRNGAFAEGDKLPSERDLAEQLEVSRATVREAIRLLAAAGIVTVRAGASGGSFVASELVPPEFLQPEFSLRPEEVIDILEARRLVLTRMAHMAALHGTDEDFARMDAAIDFARAVRRDRDRPVPQEVKQRMSVASLRFDMAMARATRNRLLVRMMTTMLTWLDPLRQMSLQSWDDVEFGTVILEEVLAAIVSGEAETIDRVFDRRMSVLERAWERLSGRPVRRARPGFLDPLHDEAGGTDAVPGKSLLRSG